MAEDYVVTRELSREMKELGARLIEQLDKTGVPVKAAYWRFDYGGHCWELSLVYPGDWDRDVPDAHFRISAIEAALKDEGLDTEDLDYRLVNEDSAAYRKLLTDVNFFRKPGMPPPPPRPRLGRQYGMDAHIYRI
ncbi:hypothetical protein LJR289_003816 [Pseudoduganella sp. LjRoot289]|uniref:hypothetical protein n=1 Tax=Pseudoduganella sp. LjRoot289 TaxID=3342314 RepID=UPI003ECC5434